MEQLNLLFAKDSLQYQTRKNNRVAQEDVWTLSEESAPDLLDEKLDMLLQRSFSQVSVVSAYNHFAIAPAGFADHQAGRKMVELNADVHPDEELMLSVNKKFGVQFYYTFPKEQYLKIKEKYPEARFNFSGEKFLNSISARGGKEIHINLYQNQCEFLALHNRKVQLYNNLDVNSEVDFLYFIMFTLSKIGFGINETHFHVYGETSENNTFISELRKFVRHLRISFDNVPKKNFILS